MFVVQKPVIPTLNNKKEKKEEPYEQKIRKIQIFYRYRTASIYRQLRIPIYERLLQQKKANALKQKQNAQQNKFKPNIAEKKEPKPLQNMIDTLFKFVSLNSKYHHREKMRFTRTPLLKYIEYDFASLNQKLKSKSYTKIYDDLEDQDAQDDEGQGQKKQYFPDPTFNQQSIAKYKRKHEIKGKICIALGYEDLKERLIDAHGWTQNQDINSLIYDLKFMSKKKNIDYVNLLDQQFVNHFGENKSITAKFGLTRNIRNIVIIGKDHNVFFPRCYDVNDVSELQDFYEDFKFTHLKSILIEFVAGQSKGKIGKGKQQILRLILNILQRQTLGIQQKLKQIEKKKPLYISIEEWKQIRKWNAQGEQQQNKQLSQHALKLYQYFSKNDPQFFLNIDNIWIVKPASMSRGRGIKTFNNLQEILDYVIGKQISWVAQKYIERPLIIRKKKFDIRQWVLLTDFKPFRVWNYQKCYVRFCSQIYTPENLKNRKIHLTNNSVTKGINVENDGIQENMMDQDTFAKQLHQKEGKQIFNSVIKPQMRKIAIQSLQSVKENIQSRKNTLQLFGYDFMIDENYKVWLIQVNSSPTMEYSTKVTTNLVKRGMSDLADLIENYMIRGKVYNNAAATELYGGWKLLTN